MDELCPRLAECQRVHLSRLDWTYNELSMKFSIEIEQEEDGRWLAEVLTWFPEGC
jgi:hypothetical protein